MMRNLAQEELALVAGGGNPMKKLARLAARNLVFSARNDGLTDEMASNGTFQSPRAAMLQHLQLP